jgi:AcrR family transcriptional regulator
MLKAIAQRTGGLDLAKAGVRGRITDAAQHRPDGTSRALVQAAITTLREEGFAGASSRAIARRAGCNQALVFYHFGTVTNLLLAALDETSRYRMERYREAVGRASGLSSLVGVARGVFSEDLDSGHMSVLAEMIAGASSTPGLGAEVAARIAPWIEFTEEAVSGVMEGSPLAELVPGRDVAHAIVALYLGLELLAHLDADRSPADALFDTAGRITQLLAQSTGETDDPAGPHANADAT